MRRLVVAVVLLGGCAATPMPRPTALNAQAAQARWPDASLAELEKGRSIHVSSCSRFGSSPWISR